MLSDKHKQLIENNWNEFPYQLDYIVYCIFGEKKYSIYPHVSISISNNEVKINLDGWEGECPKVRLNTDQLEYGLHKKQGEEILFDQASILLDYYHYKNIDTIIIQLIAKEIIFKEELLNKFEHYIQMKNELSFKEAKSQLKI